MNKKAQTGTDNRIVLKLHKALILAFAATLSFHYQTTIEAMNSDLSSQTNNLIVENIENILYQYTQDLAKPLGIKLRTIWGIGLLKTQQELQQDISEKLKQNDFNIYTGDKFPEQLFGELLKTDDQLDKLLKQQREKNLEEQILKLQKSYHQVMTRMVLTSKQLAVIYLLAPCFTLDTEGEDQAKKPRMGPSVIKTQLSDEDIINITRLATLYLANMLYIDIEQPKPNKSYQTQTTKSNFPGNIEQQRQQIHNMINRYMTNNQNEEQDLLEINTTKYKKTNLLQEEIQQQILILAKPRILPEDINIMKKLIKQLHKILKLLFEIKQKRTTPAQTTTLEITIKQYQMILNKLFPLYKLSITQLIQESPKNQFEALFLTNEENKTIQQFSQSTTALLLKTFTQTLNTYMGHDNSTPIPELLQATNEKLGTKAFVQQEGKQPLVNEQIITEPINLLTTPITEQLNSIFQNSTNYLGIESTILTLKNQLGKITEQYKGAAQLQNENAEATTERKNELAIQAIETIINFLQIMGQAAEGGANQQEIKQIVAAYTQLGILLQKQQEERKMQEEEKKRQEEAIITNLKSTTDKLSKIINKLLL